MQLGTWIPPEQTEEGGFDYLPALNGALVKWAGKRARSAATSTLMGDNPRLYVGFDDGTFAYVLLPQAGPDPFATGSGCEFTQEASECYWPAHTMLAPADWKEYLSVAEFGPLLTSSARVSIGYRLDSGGAGSFATMATDLTAAGVRVDFEESLSGKAIELRETFESDSLAVTPVVENLVLRERLHPAMRLEWAFVVDGRNQPARRDGARDRKTGYQTRETLQNAAANPATVTLVLPDEKVGGFSFVGYGEQLLDRRQRYGIEWAIPVVFVQFKTNESYGTLARLGDMTVAEAGTMTVEQSINI
jgi:hypothetical protein